MEMPPYGLGTYTVQGENCSNIISSALENGYRLIDTAELYQNHSDIAIGIKAATHANIVKREDIWLTSKIHNRDQRKLNIGPAIQKILTDLDTDYLDLIILHSAQKKYLEAYTELIRCAEHFNVKHIGVSNFRVDELEKIIDKTGITPYLNQIEISPFNQRIALRSYMAEKNIITQAYASLTCGITLNSDSESASVSAESASVSAESASVSAESASVSAESASVSAESAESASVSAESAESTSSEYLKSTIYDPDQLLLGWATHYNLRPIPTAHTTDHLIKNFHTMRDIKLDQIHVEKLDQITEIVCNYKQHADNVSYL
jgi:2,5-diketo-D-gluconate reductase A